MNHVPLRLRKACSLGNGVAICAFRFQCLFISKPKHSEISENSTRDRQSSLGSDCHFSGRDRNWLLCLGKNRLTCCRNLGPRLGAVEIPITREADAHCSLNSEEAFT